MVNREQLKHDLLNFKFLSQEEQKDRQVCDKAVSPGKGVGKELPKVGTALIVGIVKCNDDYDFFNLNTVRLSFVMNMARQIVELIKEATKDTDQSSPR